MADSDVQVVADSDVQVVQRHTPGTRARGVALRLRAITPLKALMRLKLSPCQFWLPSLQFAMPVMYAKPRQIDARAVAWACQSGTGKVVALETSCVFH